MLRYRKVYYSNLRFEHVMTKKNLHSGQHKAGISGKQEVSAYGTDGLGDLNNDFILECMD